jgi:hypothetical protein
VPQVALQAELVQRIRIHVRLEQHEGVAAGVLGRVHRRIRTSD